MKATITWTCCWCLRSSRRFECQIPSAQPHSWTRKSHVRLQMISSNTTQKCANNLLSADAWEGKQKSIPGLQSSLCCSFSPAYTFMHQAWKAKEKRSSRREGGRTTVLRRFSHSWHCSKVENWHLDGTHKIAEYKVGQFVLHHIQHISPGGSSSLLNTYHLFSSAMNLMTAWNANICHLPRSWIKQVACKLRISLKCTSFLKLNIHTLHLKEKWGKSWRGTLVTPDDFAVLAGDVKLEHISTLGALYELKRNLWIHREGTCWEWHANTLRHTCGQ